MNERRRSTNITWIQIESIPPTRPSIYVVANRQRADDCEVIINMQYGDEHNIHVKIVSPDEDGARSLQGVKEAIYLDHSFVEELSQEELQQFQRLAGWKLGGKVLEEG